MNQIKRNAVIVAGVLASVALSTSAHAQSADTLIDKLVDKGVLTVKEAKELREQSDTDFNRAYAAKTGSPDWVTSLKFGGDFRGRFEQNNADSQNYITRNRYRYRVRFGITASLLEDFEIGLRLSSGNPANTSQFAQGGSSISANTDLGLGDTRKFIWVDAAYGKWTPIHNADWNISGTIGKFDMPLVVSPMIWDADLQTEGAALQVTYNLSDKQAIKFNGLFNVIGESNQTPPAGGSPSHDPYLLGGQLLWESKWTPKIDTSLGLTMLTISGKDNLAPDNGASSVPGPNSGNTVFASGGINPAGAPANRFDPIIGSASMTYKLESFPGYQGEFPLKLSGEFMKNPSAPSNNEAWNTGITLGKAGHKGNWEIFYRYQILRSDTWYAQFTDDDNGAFYNTLLTPSAKTTIGKANTWIGGTNVKGHLIKATYSFTDSLNGSFMYYLNDLVQDAPGNNSQSGHMFVDLMWKF